MLAAIDAAKLPRADAACIWLQVIAPSVRAFLYTWGGRKTAEGEKIPVRIEELDIGYIDGMLLLPLVVEHSIDERSPLFGHTYESLRVCPTCSLHTGFQSSLLLMSHPVTIFTVYYCTWVFRSRSDTPDRYLVLPGKPVNRYMHPVMRAPLLHEIVSVCCSCICVSSVTPPGAHMLALLDCRPTSIPEACVLTTGPLSRHVPLVTTTHMATAAAVAPRLVCCWLIVDNCMWCWPLQCRSKLHEVGDEYGLMFLQALGAEVIVTFEGTSESGAQFMTRQSYLPSEMHWGYVFSEIIFHAKEGETEHSVDISRSAATCLPGVSPCASNSLFGPLLMLEIQPQLPCIAPVYCAQTLLRGKLD